jgi:tetratricopeptide (TPR) repeat protein
MILTQCPVCAVQLPSTNAKQCSRCKTRYCGPECQKTHWEGGHDKICRKIKKAGGAEQYNANKRYTEAVALAVKKCADDTKGQTCYICTEAVHWKTKEGLVRGCACRGTAGFAHVSCLAEQAKILMDEAEENNLIKKCSERWHRWHTCSLCEQDYHGAVKCALGWACWKAYVGRPKDTDRSRGLSMSLLASGLGQVGRQRERLTVLEVQMDMVRRLGASDAMISEITTNLANCYSQLGRHVEALELRRQVYDLDVANSDGLPRKNIFISALNLATSFHSSGRVAEAIALLRKTVPEATRVIGAGDEVTIMICMTLGDYLIRGDRLEEVEEAAALLEQTIGTAQRVLGGDHPTTRGIQSNLSNAARSFLATHGVSPPARAGAPPTSPSIVTINRCWRRRGGKK